MVWKLKDVQRCDIYKNIESNEIIKKLLCQRGFKTEKEIDIFLNPDYETGIHSPFLFKDMQKIISRIKKAKENKEKIGIFGDHDVDGVTSSTIIADGLEELGFEVEIYIPDKNTEGHGINKKAIQEFQKKGITLMITVDCGTNDVKEVEYANLKGIDVIITDHHLPKETLPNALAIINPHINGCTYPFKGLCGVGVAFKMLQALYEKFMPNKVDSLKWMLDIVAVGTVADCMPLVDENRVLVKYGLFVLSKTRRVGFQEMISVGNMSISPEKLPTATTIGFQIGPRINAAGRMAHARDAFELLREKNSEKARVLAEDLEEKNNKRRELTDKLVREVEKIAKRDFQNKQFIFVSNENYPVGVVGIIAGRIANKFGKPTGIFQKNGNINKGSFRSVKGINIVDVLKESSEYLEKYGGHEAAAGATIKTENVDNFIKLASEIISDKTKEKKLESIIEADLEIKLNDINIELVENLEKFEPFGEENKEPIFLIKGLEVADIRTVGNTAKHLKISLKTNKSSLKIDAIGFGFGEDLEEIKKSKNIELMANIQKNEWNGNVSVQLNIIDWRKK